jgi:hypothetical protein
MPEGTKYTLPDGTITKLTADSFVNLLDLTDTVPLIVSWEYSYSYYVPSPSVANQGTTYTVNLNTGGTLAGGVYKITDDLRDVNNLFNPFSGWDFNTTDINYIVQTKAKTQSYKYPDSANKRGEEIIQANVIIPVNKLTTDSANGVEGEWYGFINPTRWIQSSNCNIYSNSVFDLSLLKEHRQDITFLASNADTPSSTFTGYANPATETALSGSFTTNGKLSPTIYYVYNNKYGFNGKLWIKLESTSYNVSTENLNYVATKTAGIPIYSIPVAHNEYRIGNYMMGDRLTVLSRSNYNSHWCYTG